MEDPFDDHCHCHLHNIHRRAGCACLECALERELPHYKTKLWHQVNIGNKGKEKNSPYDQCAHQGSANLHRNQECRSRVGPASNAQNVSITIWKILLVHVLA
jgi:hypothetical protein